LFHSFFRHGTIYPLSIIFNVITSFLHFGNQYGKIFFRMNMKMKASEKDTEVLPSPPGLLASLIAGFDAVTTHIGVILFPVALDLLIWLGPHVKATRLIQAFSEQLINLSAGASSQTGQMVQTNQDLMTFIGDFAQRMNLLAAFRSYPVGIPSLMSGRQPLLAPAGIQPLSSEVTSFGSLFLLWVFVCVIGLIFGAVYYSAVAHAAVSRPPQRWQILAEWPRAAGQVLLLAVIWLLALIAIMIPISCILPVLTLISPEIARISLFLFGAALIWLLFPLLFSAHGIFVNRDHALASVQKSIRLTRLTLPSTGLLFLIILLLSQGLDLLWNSPLDNSWLMLVGIAGHAFVTTGLLAASFVYYRDADQWIKKMMLRLAVKQV
jgi:hypothetical protein